MKPLFILVLCGAAGTAACNDGTAPDHALTASAQIAALDHVPQVTVTDLGTLGGPSSVAFAINEAGEIVGESEIAGGSRAFLWRNGTLTNLGSLGGPHSYAVDVSARGEVLGASETALGGSHLVVWNHGTITDLGLLGGDGVIPAAINATGEIVGTIITGGAWHVFAWKRGTLTLLAPLPGGVASADAINPRGEIVGASTVTGPGGNSVTSPVLWKKDGTVIDLGTLGGQLPLGGPGASGINPAGQVVGSSFTATGLLHAFLWRNGVMTDLGTLPGSWLSQASAISASGAVAGYAALTTGGHAVLWMAGAVIDLGTRPGDVWSAANGLNSHGQVVGLSVDGAGHSHAVLWTVK